MPTFCDTTFLFYGKLPKNASLGRYKRFVFFQRPRDSKKWDFQVPDLVVFSNRFLHGGPHPDLKVTHNEEYVENCQILGKIFNP